MGGDGAEADRIGTMTIKVACVQCGVAFNDPAANAAACAARLKELRAHGVDLAVFPEAFLTGYVVGSQEDAMGIAIPLECDGQGRAINLAQPLRAIQDACRETGMHAVVGAITTDGAVVQNCALLFEPDGTVRRYFKAHLPFLGVDRFVVPGWDLPVFETAIGRIGLLVCYDLRVPEACRVLALNGADIVCLPTNWPVGAETSATHTVIARAAENRVFMAACNRVGTENGTRFIGLSGIYDVVGRVLAKAGDGEEVIVADCELDQAREKRTVIIPGEYELDVIGSRRPGLYGRIVEQ